MANPSKAKGTAAESAIVAYLREHGFPWAMRPAQHGSADRGDVWPEPGPTVIIESKSVAQGASGAPPAGLMDTWWAQTLVEARNAGADLGVLIVKRAGTTKVARWWAYVPAWLVLRVEDSEADLGDISAILHRPMCVNVETAVVMLRRAGYGDALDRAAVRPDPDILDESVR